MAIKKELCRSHRGMFVRNLGWKATPTGAYRQHTFYLGRDASRPQLASLRLEQLWQHICKRRERDKAYELNATDRPVWDEVTLTIAEAVRNGDAVARVPVPIPYSALLPESPMIGDSRSASG
jgi:hypothetical protein